MRTKFIIIVLIQTLLLTGMIVYKQYWKTRGDKILLKTMPVDPRDIFRGDYVQLRYEISTLDLNKLLVNDNFRKNENIYVILEKDSDGTYKAVAVSKVPEKNKKFIQGKITHIMPQRERWSYVFEDTSNNTKHTKIIDFKKDFRKGDHLKACLNKHGLLETVGSDPHDCGKDKPIDVIVDDVRNLTKQGNINVEYGIESYFVEEGKGRVIENARNANKLTVEVALDANGKGIITELFMDGLAIK